MRIQRPIESNIQIRKMMESVHHWLNYTHQVCRIDLLAESSLRFPIMEYLERNTLNQDCCMERPYNEFMGLEFKTIKYIDIIWGEKSKDFLMELKYVGLSTNPYSERQRYFNDIVRLSLALKHRNNQERKCYFVVSGKSDLIENELKGISIPNKTPNGNSIGGKKPKVEKKETMFNTWLSFDEKKSKRNKKIHFPINQQDVNAQYFSNFIKEYIKLDTEQNACNEMDFAQYKNIFPKIITTEQIYLSDSNDNGGQTLGIWEIHI